MASEVSQQITDTILMIRPAHFGFNEQTAANNAFQVNDSSLSATQIKQKASEEFNEFVGKLRNAGVNVIVIDDTEEPVKTDAVFPNNWISFHSNGTIITYPMFSDIRRKERRQDVVEELYKKFSFKKIERLEHFEAENKFLEGTGSMILDRDNSIVYGCSSPRTDSKVLDEFSKITGYKAVLFKATDDSGQDIYHTNVMMALGTTFAVICLDSIDPESRESVKQLLVDTGKEIINISLSQMKEFAGNMLQVRSQTGRTFLVMSERAYKSLDREQIATIEKHTEIIHSPLYTIETYGGGSARCMLAEIFVPK